MTISQEQHNKLKELSKPLVKFLCDNFNPHVQIIINPTGVEMVEGVATCIIEEFIKD